MIWHCSAHAAVRVDDFYGRLSAVSGAAAHSQVHPPLVRRRPRRVDHLHVVFPGVAAGGLRLRLPDLPLAQTPCPGYRPPGAAGIGAGSPARHTFGCLETNRRRKPGAPDSGLAAGNRRPALLRAIHHRSPDAAMVQPRQPRPLALSALRALQCRLPAGTGELPLLFRDALHPQSPGVILGVGFAGVCPLLWRLRREIVEVSRPGSEV